MALNWFNLQVAIINSNVQTTKLELLNALAYLQWKNALFWSSVWRTNSLPSKGDRAFRRCHFPCIWNALAASLGQLSIENCQQFDGSDIEWLEERKWIARQLTTWWKIEEEVSRAILDTPGVGNVNIVKYYNYVFPANSIQRLSWLFLAFSGN